MCLLEQSYFNCKGGGGRAGGEDKEESSIRQEEGKTSNKVLKVVEGMIPRFFTSVLGYLTSIHFVVEVFDHSSQVNVSLIFIFCL